MDPDPRLARDVEALYGGVVALMQDHDRLDGFLSDARAQLEPEPALVQIPDARVMAVGDLHGHLGAALWVAARALSARDVHVVALGDYVDRGASQMETLLLMLSLKRRWPERVTLLRGNHETERFSRHFGFLEEVLAQAPPALYGRFVDVFEKLPLSAHRRDGVLFLHGGIPSGAADLEELRRIGKGGRDANDPVVEELLMNDPEERPGGFSFNALRGIGRTFGLDAARDFMARSGLWLIVRGHQAVPAGTLWSLGGRVLTVFSHPDYKGTGIDGAIALIGPEGDVRAETIDVTVD